jgi:hypothetical protein
VPVEEYLRTNYDPDMEYVDGALPERHVGERGHSRLQSPIGALLAAREPGRFHTYTEQRLRVSPQPRYLVIEILSPDDEPADMLEKIADYLKFGVPHIRTPDP